MSEEVAQQIAHCTGAVSVERRAHIQTLWGGYGEAARYALTGASVPSVVVKHVKPAQGSGRSHARKLRSYAVEQAWYQQWSQRCGEQCRVPRCFQVQREGQAWLFVLEDLDIAGFEQRASNPTWPQLQACLRWLASFHATFLGEHPTGLWDVGTYWHLETRPDELQAMKRGPLKHAAAAIDLRLREARFQTFVHGDAKPANFCFSSDGRVAAVDFQYVGGGCGMKDVAYLLAGEDEACVNRSLDLYFDALKTAVHNTIDATALEAEWRTLYAWAWADFHRFVTGWSPGWRIKPHEAVRTQSVLAIARP